MSGVSLSNQTRAPALQDVIGSAIAAKFQHSLRMHMRKAPSAGKCIEAAAIIVQIILTAERFVLASRARCGCIARSVQEHLC